MNAVFFQFKCPECEWECEARFTPERPAPFCMDHDSPKFSDPGDSLEVECAWDKCEGCGHPINDAELIEQGAKSAEEQSEYADESRAEARAERRNEE